MPPWRDAEDHAEQAHRHFQAGQWQQALDALNEALEQRPDQGEWHFGLGLTLDALQRYDEAVRAFAAAVAFGGEEPAALLHLGVDQIRSGQPEAAIDTLARLNQLDPLCEMGYVHRILACAQIDRHDEAEIMFYLARDVAENAEDEDASPAARAGTGGAVARAAAHDHLARSLILRKPTDPDRAVWCWQEALRHDPRHPTAGRHLARTLYQRGQAERAAAGYQQHLAEHPHDTEARLEYADILRASTRLSDAEDQYRRALRSDPHSAAAHHQLGELALTRGLPTTARQCFHRARQLDPERPGVCLGLARAEWSDGRRDRTRALLYAELDRSDHTTTQLTGVAELLVRLRCFADAAELLNTVLNPALLPNETPPPVPRGNDATATQASARCWRGIARLGLGQFGPGLDDLRQAIRLNPRDLVALEHLATASLNAGDLASAKHWIAQGRAVGPRHRVFRRLRARWWTRRLRGITRCLTRRE